MNSKEFIQFHKETVTRMNEIVTSKNHDYTGDNGDARKGWVFCGSNSE